MTRPRPYEAARMGVGLAHQVPKPFRRLTVRQNLEVAANVLPRRRRRAVVDHVLELTGLDERSRLPAGSLRLLDLKRLEVARALSLDPELVLLDEVAAGLVSSELDEIVGLIRRIHAEGKTIVLVEHVQDVVQRLADRVIVLEWGKKLTEGAPQDVAADPRVIDAYLGAADDDPAAGQPVGSGADGPLLSIDNLSVAYGQVVAIRDFTVEIAPGEILTVVGANGAGKSTLALAIQGLVRLRSGSIRFDGADITSMAAHKRVEAGIAMVMEGRRLFAELTVDENLLLGLRKQTADEMRRMVTDVFPPLADLMDRPAGLLSGGQQQMVAIGRALASWPRLVVFDELSLGLAPIVAAQMFRAVRAVADAGTAVVLIEQNARRAVALADSVVVLKRGQTVYAGRADQLDERTFLEAYVGSIDTSR